MNYTEIIKHLLQSDVAIQFQVQRDLLENVRPDLQKRILNEGWGKKLLSFRKNDGNWGQRFYQPKWTSTHYTLLDIKNLNPVRTNKLVQESINNILKNEKGVDGGINPSVTIKDADVCLNGMVLNYASYFKSDEEKLKSIIDYILLQQLPDGGFNCRYSQKKGHVAVHSSLHSTLSVCEGLREYINNGYTYQLKEIQEAEIRAREFILIHRLYLSDRTDKIINPAFLMLSYPGRWRYDILRAMNYFRYAKVQYDERMKPAIEVLIKKRRKDGWWNLQAKHKGKTHFDPEETGKASKWNTLRVLRVLRYYNNDNFEFNF